MTKQNLSTLIACALLTPLAACDDPTSTSTGDFAREIDEIDETDGIDAIDDIQRSEALTEIDEIEAPEEESVPVCSPPPFLLNPRRSLFETSATALIPFTMSAVMQAVASNAGYPPAPLTHYNNIVNNFATGVPADPGSRCNDGTAFFGGPGINGYPLECPRAEQFQDFNIGAWFPIAAVNRIDLMPADASTCGEQRVVMANDSAGPARMFMIFENEIPNPTPGCAAACLPIAQFWERLSIVTSAGARSTELAQAFLTGHPVLGPAGFAPFLSANNLTFGSGQIRTNNFDQPPWTLREHKLANEFGQLVSVEVAAKHNIHGELWNDTIGWPAGPNCRAEIIGQLGSLLPNDVNLMAIETTSVCWAAESRQDPTMNYEAQMMAGTPVFPTTINNDLWFTHGSTLLAQEVARRATYVGSCMGCHEPGVAMPILNLGAAVMAPPSLGFVHTSESIRENCDAVLDCWLISPALKNVFLPFRQTAMVNFMTSNWCVSCSSGSSELDIAAPVDNEGMATTPTLVLVPDIEDEADIEALMEYERELKGGRSKVTISGAPTSRLH